MSQFTWTYIRDNGALHRVGLFHGDETGHLMIYCNTRIVVIDFGVTTSKNYSFSS
jgi:tRNA A-37 threonylcarbamoyl transferase component Bud32